MGITLQQFRRLQNRLSAESRRPAPVIGETHRVASSAHRLILGVDPSLRSTGYGVVRLNRAAPTLVAQGTIRCPAGWERSRCLVQIAQALRDVLKQHRPTVCVVEGLFYAQNFQTALIMGEARGATLATVAEIGLEIYEIAARKVKQAMVGYGAAQKLAVAKMVQRLLSLPTLPDSDAADALALALTFAQENGRYSFMPPKKV
jgi:crossover junction endodeoxyribonuclease RuvC